MKVDKIFFIGSMITLLLAFIMVITATVWLTYPYKPAEFKSVTILSPQVKQGGELHYIVNYCKYTQIPAQVVRAFINDIVYTTDSITTNNPIGCRSSQSVIVVPQELSKGVYYLRQTWIYKVNPVREVIITTNSDSFEVI
jgi:hypothetical protein